MSFDGNGNYTVPPGTTAVTGTAIDAIKYNAFWADLQMALSKAMLRDGQSAAQANIPMGGFKLTGLAAGSVAGDSARWEQLLGHGQTWQDLTASRALATNYTNTTGRSIEVVVTATIAASGTFTLVCQGVTISVQSASASEFRASSMIVPPGAVYQASASAGGSLNTWVELR